MRNKQGSGPFSTVLRHAILHLHLPNKGFVWVRIFFAALPSGKSVICQRRWLYNKLYKRLPPERLPPGCQQLLGGVVPRCNVLFQR